MNRTKWLRWIPALLFMIVIFCFSSQPYHQQDLRPRLHHWLPEQTIAKHFSGVHFTYAGETVSIARLGVPGFVEFFIRKGAHLSIYLLLGLSFAYALSDWGRIRSSLCAVLFSFLYACSDEFHQSLTGDRTPLFTDVLIDTCGAVIGTLLFLLVRQLRRRTGRSGRLG